MRCIDRLAKTGLIVAAVSMLTVTGCSEETEEVVVSYETEHYNKELYRGDLFAQDLCVTPGDTDLAGAPDLTGVHAAALFDLDGEKTDFAYRAHERLYPASTTKIMTALVALQNGNLDDVVTVSATASSDAFAADESVCGIKEGDQLTLLDLLYGLLLHSGNDNAVAIAEHVGGSTENFANMMNEEAERLMATNTHFMNPSGLHDDNHYTTAYDLYLIFNECIKHQEFIDIIESASYTANITQADGSIRQDTWEPSHFYAQGETRLPQNVTIIGGKTGTTKLAGNCLILLEKDGLGDPYVSVVMGADTKELLYQDMTALIEAIPIGE